MTTPLILNVDPKGTLEPPCDATVLTESGRSGFGKGQCDLLDEGFMPVVLRPNFRLGYNMLTTLLVSICLTEVFVTLGTIHPFIHLSFIHPPVSICLSFNPFFVCPFLHVCPSIPSFTRLFVHPFIRPSIHLSINRSIVLMSLHGINTLN